MADGLRLVRGIKRGWTTRAHVDDLHGDDKIGTAIAVWRAEISAAGFVADGPPRTTIDADPTRDGNVVQVDGFVRSTKLPDL